MVDLYIQCKKTFITSMSGGMDDAARPYDDNLNTFLREGDVVNRSDEYGSEREAIVLSVNEEKGRMMLFFGDGSDRDYPMLSEKISKVDVQLMYSMGSPLTIDNLREFEHGVKSAELEARLGRTLTGRENQQIVNDVDDRKFEPTIAALGRAHAKGQQDGSNKVLQQHAPSRKEFQRSLEFVHSFNSNRIISAFQHGPVNEAIALFYTSLPWATKEDTSFIRRIKNAYMQG